MTTRRTLSVLCLFLALIVTVWQLDRRRAATINTLLNLGDVSRIEMHFQGKKLLFNKSDSGWALVTIDEKPVRDTRVNSGLLTHILDLIRVLKKSPSSGLDAKDADQYGMSNPELTLTLDWQHPTPGEDAVLFGHRDISGKKSFAFFPRQPLLVEVEASALAVLEGKGPLDMRDRHVTTFEPDDVEDLEASGKCRPFKLSRDGDHWVWSKPGSAAEATDRWLADLTSMAYDEIDEAGTPQEQQNEICSLIFRGRRGRTETLRIYKYQGTVWAANTALAARYHLPTGVMKLLLPPSAARQ